MAAIQPWSAAGAEKPMVTALPAAALGLVPASAPLVWAAFGVSLLVHAASSALAPTAVPPMRKRRREGVLELMIISRNRVHWSRRPSRHDVRPGDGLYLWFATSRPDQGYCTDLGSRSV